ncbi:MAG: hypothetical protein AAFZ91_00600 [Pseudomonadota bacterium]
MFRVALASVATLLLTTGCGATESAELRARAEACVDGNERSCRVLKDSYWKKITDENFVGFNEQMCANEQTAALCGMQNRRREVDAFPKDGRASILAHLKAACDVDVIDACKHVAELLSHNDGRSDLNHIDEKPDYHIATTYRMKACDLGDYYACLSLGSRYSSGRTVMPRNLARDPARLSSANALTARLGDYLRNRCDADFGNACADYGFGIAKFYRHSAPTASARELVEGLDALEKGCALESWRACERLSDIYGGEVYRKGSGVTADPERATAFFEKACAARDTYKGPPSPIAKVRGCDL